MRSVRFCTVSVIIALGIAATAFSARPEFTGFQSPDDLSPFMQTYYLHPSPELTADAIAMLASSVFVSKATSTAPAIAFFGEVFAANPDRVRRWQVLIEKQDAPTKALLHQALSLAKSGGVLALEGHSPQLNDMYWGAFFASGKADYLRRLIGQLRYIEERTDRLLFFTGASAKWSLASNSQSHERVRATLEAARADSDDRTRVFIDELLTQKPETIRQQIAAIVRKQHDAGLWK